MVRTWSWLQPTPAFMPEFAAVLCGECAMAVHLPVDDGPTHVWDYTAVAMLSSLWKTSRRAIIVHGEASLPARHGLPQRPQGPAVPAAQ